jgi:hypothetical protein
MCTSPHSAGIGLLELELNPLVDRIGELARVIDLACQRAQLQQGSTGADMVVALAEASHGLHRARIALADSTRFASAIEGGTDR